MEEVFIKYYQFIISEKLNHVRELIGDEEYHHKKMLLSEANSVESLQELSFMIDALSFGEEYLKNDETFQTLMGMSREEAKERFESNKDGGLS